MYIGSKLCSRTYEKIGCVFACEKKYWYLCCRKIQKAFIDACFGVLNPAKFINHPRQDGNRCPRDMYITCPQGQTYISAWTDVVYSCGRVLQEPKDKEKQFVSRFFCIHTTFFLVHCSVVAVRWCTFAAELKLERT